MVLLRKNNIMVLGLIYHFSFYHFEFLVKFHLSYMLSFLVYLLVNFKGFSRLLSCLNSHFVPLLFPSFMIDIFFDVFFLCPFTCPALMYFTCVPMSSPLSTVWLFHSVFLTAMFSTIFPSVLTLVCYFRLIFWFCPHLLLTCELPFQINRCTEFASVYILAQTLRVPEFLGTRETWQIPCFIAWQAKCRATKDEEHALSMAKEGPVRLKVKEILLAAMLIAVPVPL